MLIPGLVAAWIAVATLTPAAIFFRRWSQKHGHLWDVAMFHAGGLGAAFLIYNWWINDFFAGLLVGSVLTLSTFGGWYLTARRFREPLTHRGLHWT